MATIRGEKAWFRPAVAGRIFRRDRSAAANRWSLPTAGDRGCGGGEKALALDTLDC